jgi:hypothetical protein
MRPSPKIKRLLLLALPLHAAGFYLPGAAPKDYEQGEIVEVDVNVLKPGLGYDQEQLVSDSLLIPFSR